MRREINIMRNAECGMQNAIFNIPNSEFRIPNLLLKIFLLILFANCQLPIANCQSATDLFKSANQQYKSNQFDQAAATYEKILSQGYKTAEIYYNLGNCYYKLNNINKTILSYERALKLAPNDEDIQHNLKLADARVIDKIIPVPQLSIIAAWDNLVNSKSSKGWGSLALVFMWLALIFFAIYIFAGWRNITLTAGCLLVLLSLSSFGFALAQNEKEQNPDMAILTLSNSYVKSAPDENGNNLFMLHEGVKFQVLDKVGEWNKIRLADGKIGWLEKSTFEKI